MGIGVLEILPAAYVSIHIMCRAPFGVLLLVYKADESITGRGLVKHNSRTKGVEISLLAVVIQALPTVLIIT